MFDQPIIKLLDFFLDVEVLKEREIVTLYPLTKNVNLILFLSLYLQKLNTYYI